MIRHTHNAARWTLALVAGWVLVLATPLRAANFTWTNTTSDASGYWTNGVLWGSSGSTPYPGSAANLGGDSAYLTNGFSGTYTNILNSRLVTNISTLAISNALGEAWLILTNGASSPVVTNTTFTLGIGGRLEIDNGGALTNTTTFNWVGTNGTIYLNNGGKLITASAVTIGAGGGVTGLVTSVSGAGNGGVWDFNNKLLTIGSGNGNLITITSGAILTNLSGLTISGNQNSLIASNGGAVFGNGAIAFAATAAQFGNTINLGNGIWNLSANALNVGNAANASNNTFIGGTVTNALSLKVGLSVGANNNTVIITNGGQFIMNVDNGNNAVWIGGNNQSAGGSGNTVILSNSVLRTGNAVAGGGPIQVGWGSSNNTLQVLGGSVWDGGWTNGGQGQYNGIAVGGNLNIVGGLVPQAYNNYMLVNNAIISNINTVAVGYNASSGATIAISNRLEVINGGILSNVHSVLIGGGAGVAAGSGYNSLVVTGANAAGAGSGLFMDTAGAIAVGGSAGSGNNTLILSNSVLLGTSATIGSGSSNNAVTLYNTTWGNSGAALNIGTAASTGNVLRVTGSTLTNFGLVSVGGIAAASASSFNQFIIENGVLSNFAGLNVGFATLGSNNTFIATNNARVFMTSGRIDIGSSADGQTAGGGGNTVILSNSVLTSSGNFFTSVGVGSSNNTFTVLAGTVWDNGNKNLVIGGSATTGAGGNFQSYNNVMTVNGAVISNAGTVDIGYMQVGTTIIAISNQLNVINGGIVSNVGALQIGGGTGAAGFGYNSLVVTGASSAGVGSGFFMTGAAGPVSVGASAGSGNNVVILSNSVILGTGVTIGSGSSNNTVTLFANTVWNNGGALVVGGANNAGIGNALTVSGGILSNVTTLNVGNGAGSINYSNSVSVMNGGQFRASGAITIGQNGSSNNIFTVDGGSQISPSSTLVTNASTLIIGSGTQFNDLNITNATVVTVGGLTIGSGAGASNNNLQILGSGVLSNAAAVITVGTAGAGYNTLTGINATVASLGLNVGTGNSSNNIVYLDATTWNFGAGVITVGSVLGTGTGGATGNQFIVSSAGTYGLTNIGGINLYDQNDSLFLSNQNLAASINALNLGVPGLGGNNLTLSNQNVTTTTGGSTIGRGSSNNTLTLFANTVWNNSGLVLTNGTVGTTGNVLVVNGGVLTNFGGLQINGNQNSVIVSNGGKLFGSGVITFTNGGFGNTLTMGDGAWGLGANGLSVGGGANSSNNAFNIVGGTVSNTSAGSGILSVGNAAGANNNSLIVTNGGSFTSIGAGVGIGATSAGAVGGNNNTVTFSNAYLSSSASAAANYIGSGSSNNIVTLLTNTVWNFNGGIGNVAGQGTLIIGTNGAVGNVVNVNGGMITNLNTGDSGHAAPLNNLLIGVGTGSISNQMIIQNGGLVSNVSGLVVGGGPGSSYNSLIATNGGRIIMSTDSGSSILVGSADATGKAGGGNNTVIVSNSVLRTALGTGSVIGGGSSNNTLTMLGGASWAVFSVNTATPITIGTGAAVGNNLTINGGVISNFTTLAVGSGGGATNFGNSVVVTNGGQLFVGFDATPTTIGTGGSSNNSFIVDGGTSVSTLVSNSGAFSLSIGAAGSANNMLSITNAKFFMSGQLTIGGGGAAVSNQVLINAGGRLQNDPNGVTGTTLYLGTNGGASFNSLIVTGGSFVMNSTAVSGASGSITVGSGGSGQTGGNNNTLILSNSTVSRITFNGTPATYIGSGSSNNVVTLLANTAWDNASRALVIGTNLAFNNVMTINGGIFSNAGTVSVGLGANAVSNQLLISNGGVVSNATGLVVGNGSGANFNSLIVTNGGRFVDTAGSYDLIGAGVGGAIGGNNNTVILSNSILLGGGSTVDAYIGSGSSNNSLTLLNSTWNNVAGANLTIGTGAATNNTLTITGGSVYNIAALTIGGGGAAFSNRVIAGGIISNVAGNLGVGIIGGASFNSLIVTDAGGFVVSGGIVAIGATTVGGVGGGNNTVIFSNSALTTASQGTSWIGSGSSNNVLTILTNSLWNLQGVAGNNPASILTIGNGAAYNNVLTVDGASLSNIIGGNGIAPSLNALRIGIGVGGAISNQVIVQNGGVISNVGGLIIGGAVGASYNSLIVTNGGRFIEANGSGNSAILLGAADSSGAVGGGNNTAILSNSVLTANAASFIGSGSSNNAMTLLANSTWNNSGFALTVGTGAATGNVLIINGGIATNFGALNIGGASPGATTGNKNSLTVSNGGQLFGSGAITINYQGYSNTFTMGSGFWNFSAQNLFVGRNAGSSNNAFNVVGGVVSNISSIFVGGRNDGSSAGLASPGADFNSLVVTNGGRLFMDAGDVLIGATYTSGGNNGLGGGSGNTVILSNSVIKVTSALNSSLTIGWSSSNNTLTLLADTVWDNGALGIIIGRNGPTLGNVLTVSGALFTNTGAVTIGGTAAGSTISNQLIINQGGVVSNVTALNVGTAPGANYNSVLVTNGGKFFMNTGAIAIGNNSAATAGGGNNTVILSNSLVTVNAPTYIGTGSSNNTVTLLANTVMNGGNSALNLGGLGTAGVSNVMTINGGILTNVSTLSVGNGAGNVNFGNSLIVTNGGRLGTANVGGTAIIIGQSGSSSNTFIIDGGSQALPSSTMVSNASGYFQATIIGQAGSSFNTLTINNATFIAGGLAIGKSSAGTVTMSNQVVVGVNGILTNVDGLTVGGFSDNAGGSGGNFNSLIVTNGGRFIMTNGQFSVGAQQGTFVGGNNNTVILSNSAVMAVNAATYIGTGSSNNTVTLLANTAWNNSGFGITLGQLGSANSNALNVSGGLLTNVTTLTVGAAAGANYNSVVLSNGGQLSVVGNTVMGNAGNSNSITVVGGAANTSWSLTNLLTIGTGGATGNILNVTSGGTVIATNIVISASATDSNNQVNVTGGNLYVTNGTTANLIIGSAGAGSVTVTNGTVVANQISLGGAAGGVGTLTVNNQGVAVVTNSALTLGQAASTFGAVVLNSNGLLVVGNNPLVIGASGGGQLTINGGILSNAPLGVVNALGSLILGQNSSGTGAFTVASGSFIVTNTAASGQLIVGQSGRGTLTLSGGSLTVNQLLVTNNVGNTLTNSFFSFTGGTLITSNAANQVAFNYIVPTNVTPSFTGTFIALGGTNIVNGQNIASSQFQLGANSTLLVSNGAVFQVISVGNTAASGPNVNVTVAGTGSVLTLGGSSLVMNQSNGSILVANGGVISNSYGSSIGLNKANPNTILVTDPGSIYSNYASANSGVGNFNIYGGGSLIVSNQGKFWNGGVANSGLIIGHQANATGAYVIVTGTGSVLTAASPGTDSLIVGDGYYGIAVSNWVLVSNGGALVSGGASIGRRGGQSGGQMVNSNSVTVTDPGSYWNNTGALNLGGASAAGFTNNNFNYVIISNSASFRTAGAIIGANGGVALSGANRSNYLIVTGSGSVMTNTSTLVIGSAYTLGNYAIITNGATYVGAGNVTIGNGNSALLNILNIVDASYQNAGAVTVGTGSSASNNQLNIVGATSTATFSNNGQITVGRNGGGFNTMFATNANLWGGLTLGDGSSNNTVTVQDNVTWNFLNYALEFGLGTGNVLNIFGGSVLTNVGGVVLAGENTTFALTNANGPSRNIILGTSGSISVGDTAGWGDNTLLISNQVFRTGNASQVGAGSSNNVLTILTNTVWDGGGAALTVGSGAATGNVLTINGGMVTNLGLWTVQGNGNSLIVTNGGLLAYTGGANHALFGGTSNTVLVTTGGVISNTSTLSFDGAGNRLIVAGGGQFVMNGRMTGGSSTVLVTDSNSVFTITAAGQGGLEGGNGAGIIVSNGATFLDVGAFGMNGGGVGANLYVLVTGTGSLFQAASLQIGYVKTAPVPGTNNSLTVTDGARAILSGGINLTGVPYMSNEFVLVSSGGSITAASFSIATGGTASWSAGNLIHVTGTGSVFAASGASTVGGVISGKGEATNNANNGILVDFGGRLSVAGLTIGTSWGGSNDYLTINAGLVTNTSTLVIGGQNAIGNSLTVTNGGVYIGGGAISIGSAANSSNNLLIVNGGDQASAASTILSNNGLITVGGSGGGFNTMTATNANLWTKGLSIGAGSSNNAVTVQSDVAWDLLGNILTWGSGAATNNQLSGTSAISNVGGLNIGEAGLSVFLTNGLLTAAPNNQTIPINFGTTGAFLGVGTNTTANGASVTISNYTFLGGTAMSTIGGGSSNNTVTVLAGSTWQSSGAAAAPITIGFGAASGNVLRVSSGGLVSNVNITVGVGAAQSNQLILSGGTVWGNVLRATNASNVITFNAGTLNSFLAYVSNNVFTVGDGVQRATFNALLGGTNYFGSGITIATNATIKGVGTIRGILTLNGGATIAPGNGPGILNVENMTWNGGGIYSNDVVNFTGGVGTGWDYINGSAALTFSPTAENFILRLDSGGAPAANFITNQDYSLAIAGFATGITGFDPARFTIDTNAFLNTYGGTFGITRNGTNLYLTYSGVNLTPDFVWTNGVSAPWSRTTAWTNTPSIPPTNGSATLVVQFDGAGTASYTATNDETTGANSYTNNKIVFNSGSTGTNTLLGATNVFVGADAGIYQIGGSAFIVSNSVTLATNTIIRGPGLGFVTLASNILGNGQLSMVGAFNLTLQGSNTFAGPVLMNSTSGGTLTIGNLYALGTNNVTVSNGTAIANTAGTSYIVGNGWSNQQVLVTGSGSVWTNVAGFVVGSGAAANDGVTVDNNGRLFASAVVIGTNGAAGNSLVLTNGGDLVSTGVGTIGFVASSNSLLVVGGVPGNTTVWNLNNGTLTVGSGTATGNVLRIDGLGAAGSAVVTNLHAFTVGVTAAANSLVITNGGQLFINTTGSPLTSRIGNGGSNNLAVVVGTGSLWNNGGAGLTVGDSAAVGNQLLVSGNAVVTNVGLLTVGGVSGAGDLNLLVVTNGGRVFSSGLTVGGSGADSNTVIVAGGNARLDAGGQPLSVGVGGAATGNVLRIDNGGMVTNGFVVVGDGAVNARFNLLIVTNGGQLFTSGGTSIIGKQGVANTGLVSGASSRWDGGNNDLTIGAGSGVANSGATNGLVVENGGLLTNVATLWVGAASTTMNNLLSVSNATLVSQNLLVGGNGNSGNQLLISGVSTVSVTTALTVTNANNNRVTFNGGLLRSGGTVYSNGTDFVVGDGTQTATFDTLTGAHLFQQNVVVTNNGTLAGTGTVIVNGGAGSVVIGTNGVLSPGGSLGLGTLTISGTNTWAGGGRYRFEISDFTGASSGATDLVKATYLLVSATTANPFVINLNSLNSPTTAGLANNFDKDGSYTLTLATATTSVNSFSADEFSVSTASFSNVFDGVWTVAQSGLSLVLNYAGATNFVWDNVSGSFSNLTLVTPGINWLNDVPPPLNTTNVVLYFGGVGSDQYTATNNLDGVVAKKIVLTNSSSATQYIVGNSITLGGLAPTLQQNSNGTFVISNAVVMATNLTVLGSGSGTLSLNGVLGGAYSLTKTGNFTLVLGGADTNTGSTIVDGGTLTVRNNNALVTSTQLLVNLLGTMVADGGAPTVNKLAGSGAVVLTNGAALALNNAGVNNNSSFAGVISGDGSVTKVGANGTLTLTGASTYQGNTLVSAGALTVSGAGSLASTNLTVMSGGTFNWANVTALTNGVAVTVNGTGRANFSTDGTIGALSGNGTLNVNANTVQVGFGNVSSSFAGTFSGSGTLALFGAGTFTLNDSAGSLGFVTVTNGTLALTNTATLAVTAAGSSSAVTVTNAGMVLVHGSQLTANNLNVQAGGTFLLNSGSVTVGNYTVNQGGTVLLNAGSTTVNTTLAVNSGGALTFNGGTLSAASTVYSNGTDFVIGDGTHAATFNTLSGLQLFQQNLVVANNGTLAGFGTVIVSGGNGAVVLTSNGVVSAAGSGTAGTLTINGTNVWAGGGRYLWDIVSFSNANTPSFAGTDWDYLSIAGVLSNAATASNPFVIDTAAGVLPSFDKEATYNIKIATAASGLVNVTPGLFSVDTTHFSNAFDGVWSVAGVGNDVFLNYAGATNFVWDNVTGAFSNSSPVGINWLNNVAPPAATTNVVMYFGGVVGDAYTASNDITGLVTKRIVLTNQSTATQYIIGNAIMLAGLAPEIQQNESGGFIISNALVMATNTLFGGSGGGVLEVDGSIGGAFSLTKTGSYTLVLGGSNTYSGVTIISNGQVQAANRYALATTAVSNLVNGGVGFDVTNAILGALSGSGNIDLTNTVGAGVAVSVGAKNGNATYTGVLGGSGSLTKVGSGTATLTAGSTYNGDTLVNAGTLAVSGQLASTNLIVTGGDFNWANALALPNTVAVVVSNLGNLNFRTDGTIGALGGNGDVVVVGSATAQVGYGGVSSSFAGALLGTGTVTKVGSGGTLTLTGANNALSNVVVTAGTLALSASTAQLAVTNLTVTGGGFALNTGTLTVRGAATLSNGLDFVVGNGSGAATFNVLGTAALQQDLVVTNNGTLKGSGTIVVAGGQGNVIIQSGGVQAPGNGLGTQTVVGTNVWQGGGRYQWQINDFAGTKGTATGWDWLNVLGTLTNTVTSNPFLIDITSLNDSNPGLAANFNSNGKYTNILATASTPIDFVASSYQLSTVNFSNAFDGVFQLQVLNGTNLVLTYAGSDVYTWKDITGGFSNVANWVEGNAPPVGASNIVAYFGGSTGAGYVGTNDIAGLVLKNLILTNNTATVQTLVGSNLTFGGLAPELLQLGSGAFLISNDVVLAANTVFGSNGSGAVTMAGNISDGSSDYSLTKTGSWALVLGGSNTFSGVTVVQAGNLFVANVDALRGSTLSNLVAGGAVGFTNVTNANFAGLAGNGVLGLTNTAGSGVGLSVGFNNTSTTYGGALTGSGSLTKVGTGTLTLGGISTYSGGTVVTRGTLVATWLTNGLGTEATGSSIGSGSLTLNGGTMKFDNGGLLAVTNTLFGLVEFNGGSLNSATVVNQGQMRSVSGTSRIVSDLYNDNSGVLSNLGGTLFVGEGAGMITNAGTIALAGGTLDAGVITNTGTVVGFGTLSSLLANSGVVSATNGQLNLQGYVTGAGPHRAEAGATLSFNSGGTISALFNPGGTIRVASLVTNTATFNNAGTLVLVGGIYQTPTQLTNDSAAWITGYGTINAAATLVNQGKILANSGSLLVLGSDLYNTGTVAANGGKLQVSGVFTNDGTLNFTVNSFGTFSSAVVNNKAWVLSDGSDNLFNKNLTVTTNGYVAASAGSTLKFQGDLLNQSTDNLAWNTMNASLGTNSWSIGTGTKFLFAGASLTQTQVFETPGLLLTGGFSGSPSLLSTGVQDVISFTAVSGFYSNFAVGQLWLTNTTLELAQAIPSSSVTNALFVNDLYLFGDSQLVISNNMRLYFVNSNSWSMAHITLLGDAQIHQLNALNAPLLVIPEPNVLLMWLSGAVTLWAARRRSRQRPS